MVEINFGIPWWYRFQLNTIDLSLTQFPIFQNFGQMTRWRHRKLFNQAQIFLSSRKHPWER